MVPDTGSWNYNFMGVKHTAHMRFVRVVRGVASLSYWIVGTD